MTVDEIRAAIAADPEIYALLPDVEAVRDALSVGRKRMVKTRVGPGTIMSALGAVEGATLLETLTAMAAQSAAVSQYVPIKWAMKIIDRGEFDLGDPASRDQVAALCGAGAMTTTARDKLLALGEVADPLPLDYVRWAIFNDDGSRAV